MWELLEQEWIRAQHARDYFVHHAGRYGWGPPQDRYQACVVIAMRIWEVHSHPGREQFEERWRELRDASGDGAIDLVARTLEAFSAVAGYHAARAGDEPLTTRAMVELWAADPWAVDDTISEAARGSRRSMLVLAYYLGLRTPEQVDGLVVGLEQSAASRI